MKNYRYIVPLLIIVLFLLSFYTLYTDKADSINTYNELLSTARHYRELDIRVDAEEFYMQAYKNKPSVELSVEIGEYYQEKNQIQKLTDWAEEMLKEYPKEVAAYEFSMDLFAKNKDHSACFRLADSLKKRNLKSEKISNYINTIEYEYFFKGSYVEVGAFYGGVCPVLVGDKWGYVNQKGSKVVSNKYKSAGYFVNGLAPIVDLNGDAYYIDSKGNKKFVVQNVDNVVDLGEIVNNVYSVYNNDNWSFYNRNYELLFGGYSDVSIFGNGVAAVKDNDEWSLIDTQGNAVTDEKYISVAMDEMKVVLKNGRMFVNEGSGYKMIDETGKVYGDQIYQDVRLFNNSTYAAVMIDGKWGFVNNMGEVVISPKYEEARSFSCDHAAVKIDGKWGFINMKGEIVIAPQFDDAKDFNSSGCVFVYNKNAWQLLLLYKYNH